MLPAYGLQSPKIHETVEAFQSIGLPLNKTLTGMLNENPEHQRPRRGSGFTQASRYLANLINQPRGLCKNRDLVIFSEAGQRNFLANTATLKPSPSPENNNPTHNIAINAKQIQSLIKLPLLVHLEESRLIIDLILSILGHLTDTIDCPALPLYKEKLNIGTCPEAERYFLEIGGGYQRRQSVVNIITDEHHKPLLIEKINLGDSHSCITLQSVKINRVIIPPGSLLGTHYSTVPIHSPRCKEFNGAWLPTSIGEGFRVLRLTTLAISPQNRARAFGNHLAQQLENSSFFDPTHTCLADLR